MNLLAAHTTTEMQMYARDITVPSRPQGRISAGRGLPVAETFEACIAQCFAQPHLDRIRQELNGKIIVLHAKRMLELVAKRV
jgi:hypothetical protein